MLQPLSHWFDKAFPSQTTPAADAPTPAAPGNKGKTAAAAAAKAPQQQQLTMQLLIDPMLCPLPWEGLPHFGASCSSVTRCFSMAQLRGLMQGYGGGAAAAAMAAAPAVLELGRMTYLADVAHDMSSQAGSCAPPLIPQFRCYLVGLG